MNNEEARVEVKCSNEGNVVGHMEIPVETGAKGFLLSSRIVWAKFRPVVEAYRLPKKMQGDGHVLRCSRCGGMLCIEGETKTAKEEKPEHGDARDLARSRAVQAAQDKGEVNLHMKAHGIDPSLMPITLGKTRIGAVR